MRLRALSGAVVAGEHVPTPIRDPMGVAERHLADSLVALDLPEVRAARRAADLGAGPGFPGLALAAALPECEWTLVESVGRKAAFIRRAAATAELGNVVVVAERAEEWEAGLGRCDLVTARALAALDVVLEYAAPLLRIGGAVVAWKGAVSREEALAGDAAAAVLGLGPGRTEHVTPYPDSGERTLYVYSKVRGTPDRFPRRAGIARKRPLGGSGRA